MHYKEILTEKAAEQFKKEGATIILITLYNKISDEEIRTMEVALTDDNKVFAIAGRTPAAEAAMNKYFCGNIVDGEKWFPFTIIHRSEDADKIVAEVAHAAGLNTTDLKWSYINVR